MGATSQLNPARQAEANGRPAAGVVPVHATVVDALAAHADRSPDRTAFTFLADGEQTEISISFGELDRRAGAIAAFLRTRATPGERAMLLFEPGIDFIAALFGCLYAGVVAVPAFPPDPRKLDVTAQRLDAMASDAGARLVLATRLIMSLADEIRAAAPALGRLEWIATDGVDGDGVFGGWPLPTPDPAALAYLQYTSGSTGEPKGVMVSHANLTAQVELIRGSFELTSETSVVSWLPMYHDMGLVGHVMTPINAGCRQVLLSPIAFLQRPTRWLRAISRYRGAVSGGPNFGYELCLRKVAPETLADLDLSCWRLAYSGSEPVRAETLRRFADGFAPAGFRREAFYPCWGLAEGTLQVTGSPGRDRPVVRRFEAQALERDVVVEGPVAGPGARALVGCGEAIGHRVEIVDPHTLAPCPPERVGEIWVSGPCVAMGYWKRPRLTGETFGARLAGSGEGPFLRTGDLGFVRDGVLFPVGRLKDVIIIRGRNLAAHDVELTVERSHPALRPGCGAAVPVDTGDGEGLAVIHEIAGADKLDMDSVTDAIRGAVLREHGVQPTAIALVQPRTVPKTTSGKVRRRECRAALLSGSLPAMNTPAEPATRGGNRP